MDAASGLVACAVDAKGLDLRVVECGDAHLKGGNSFGAEVVAVGWRESFGGKGDLVTEMLKKSLPTLVSHRFIRTHQRVARYTDL